MSDCLPQLEVKYKNVPSMIQKEISELIQEKLYFHFSDVNLDESIKINDDVGCSINPFFMIDKNSVYYDTRNVHRFERDCDYINMGDDFPDEEIFWFSIHKCFNCGQPNHELRDCPFQKSSFDIDKNRELFAKNANLFDSKKNITVKRWSSIQIKKTPVFDISDESEDEKEEEEEEDVEVNFINENKEKKEINPFESYQKMNQKETEGEEEEKDDDDDDPDKYYGNPVDEEEEKVKKKKFFEKCEEFKDREKEDRKPFEDTPDFLEIPPEKESEEDLLIKEYIRRSNNSREEDDDDDFKHQQLIQQEENERMIRSQQTPTTFDRNNNESIYIPKPPNFPPPTSNFHHQQHQHQHQISPPPPHFYHHQKQHYVPRNPVLEIPNRNHSSNRNQNFPPPPNVPPQAQNHMFLSQNNNHLHQNNIVYPRPPIPPRNDNVFSGLNINNNNNRTYSQQQSNIIVNPNPNNYYPDRNRIGKRNRRPGIDFEEFDRTSKRRRRERSF